MTLQTHPNVIMKPAGVAEWHNCGTSLVAGERAWPAEDWRELVDLWSTGIGHRVIERHFEARGYTAADLETMSALLWESPFILPPIERALFILAGLARRGDRRLGTFVMWGGCARSADVVRAANRMLCALALPQIRYPNAASEA